MTRRIRNDRKQRRMGNGRLSNKSHKKGPLLALFGQVSQILYSVIGRQNVIWNIEPQSSVAECLQFDENEWNFERNM